MDGKKCVLEQTERLRLGYSLRPLIDAKLSINIFGMVANCIEADEQLVGDLLILLASGDEVQNLQLSFAQMFNKRLGLRFLCAQLPGFANGGKQSPGIA